ncbi:NAD(P)-dependent oxidoreductase [Algoriphagus halophytocola]|uniref:Saccharopine dehydrogenase [NAD(+), L-lysine-forming] n=1 Tax=Algoriphagus halophytocola TaxID=2991499 RepID=A0ABY6MCN5_9BACT|nr:MULTISPECIES: NAD(P)-dependent oxidoreductase [unclassified Algoriphagus]UZD21470.1 NAD(P)-dependent oxidoreductase [Algoriphagus sp. TR-M5]WBL42682.1 NAD(P)-dependent oxidoreductase [Algoriphagus sp. TR-M9]
MIIGIIREGKNPPDKRVAFAPVQLKAILDTYPGKFHLVVESSTVRAFSDEEYRELGIEVKDDLADCEVIFGVKEVPVDQLIEGKTYIFFSHTIKEQPANRKLLQAVLDKNIRLIDYETLKNESGDRVVAFGRWAGLVGAYNAFWTYGMKTGLYEIKRAHECDSLEELFSELGKVQLPPIKIVLTGSGRVGRGAMSILEKLGILQVNTHDFLHQYLEEPVFVLLRSEDLYRRKSDGGFDKEEFYSFPERYESHFQKFAEHGEMLISGAYWNPDAPRLFEIEAISEEDFQFSVIADISCDVGGSIPTTLRSSTIAEPVYDVDRDTGRELPAFGQQTSISVMAIDNLPCELPRESSVEFGRQLIEWVIPALLEENSAMLERATIARDGDLTIEYIYLSDYVNAQDKAQ